LSVVPEVMRYGRGGSRGSVQQVAGAVGGVDRGKGLEVPADAAGGGEAGFYRGGGGEAAEPVEVAASRRKVSRPHPGVPGRRQAAPLHAGRPRSVSRRWS